MSTQTPLLIKRKEAGLLVATRLRQFHVNPRTLIPALPRGGDEVGTLHRHILQFGPQTFHEFT